VRRLSSDIRTRMLRRASVVLTLSALLIVATATASGAQTVVTENGDAGSLPATAQVIPGEVSTITGSLAILDQEDLYRVCLAPGQAFSATTAGTTFDTELFLFDATGRGVVANDDSAAGSQAAFPAGLELLPTTGGIYYLGVSFFPNEPLSSGGPIFTGPDGDVIIDDVRYSVPQPPAGDQPVTEWSFTGAGEGGAYQIQLTGTTSGCAPTTKRECKNGGWRNFGTMFKNQGGCITYVNGL
jgi:hypothetical protein